MIDTRTRLRRPYALAASTAVVALTLAACSGGGAADDGVTTPPAATSAPGADPSTDAPSDAASGPDAGIVTTRWSYRPEEGSISQILDVTGDPWLVRVADDDGPSTFVELDAATGAVVAEHRLAEGLRSDECAAGPTSLVCFDREARVVRAFDRSSYEVTGTVEGVERVDVIADRQRPGMRAQPVQLAATTADGWQALDASGQVLGSWKGSAEGLDVVLWNGTWSRDGRFYEAGRTSETPLDTLAPRTLHSPTRATTLGKDRESWDLLDEKLERLGSVKNVNLRVDGPVDPGEGCPMIGWRPVTKGKLVGEAFLLDRDTFEVTELSEPIVLGLRGAACIDGTIYTTGNPVTAGRDTKLWSVTSDGTATALEDDYRDVLGKLSEQHLLLRSSETAWVFDVTTGETVEKLPDLRLNNNLGPRVEMLEDGGFLFAQTTSSMTVLDYDPTATPRSD